MSLSRFSHGRAVPPELYRTRPVQAIEHSATDYSFLVNDVFSYRKEIEYEGELHNAVLVVRNFLDCSEERAFGVVDDLMKARLAEFKHAAAIELPSLFRDYGINDDVQEMLLEYVEELRNWMTGIVNWHEKVGRYTERELNYHPMAASALGGPTGIGTSSLRISDLLPTGR
jgi:germacradienol/geosmin synthase